MAEKKTIQDAVKEILKLRTKEIFKNIKHFWALLDDLAPECAKERKMIKRSLDEELLAVFIDDSKTVKHRIKILLDNFDDLGVKEDCADFIIESFGLPLGWNQEIREMKLNRPVTPPSMLSPTNGKVSYADIVLNEDTLKHLGIIDKKSLTTVNIPASFNTYVGTVYRITKIDDNIFKDCDKLETVVIPDTVTEIGNNAFNGCKALKDVNIPNDVTKIGNGAFCGCSALQKIIIPNNVTEIGVGAFRDCELLENVILPDSLTKIGDYAFANCKSFTNIIIPNNAKDVSLSAFLGCDKIEQFTLPSRLTAFVGFLTEITLDENVLKQLGYDIKYKNKNNDNSEVIQFTKNGKEVKELYIPFTYSYDGKAYIITKISNYTFRACKSLTKVVIPDSITFIGDRVFDQCTSLKNIVISKKIGYIGKESFQDCPITGTLKLPNSLTYIGYDAFYNCTSLTNIIIPNSVTQIVNNAFSGVPHIEYHGSASGARWGANSMN